MGICPTEVTVKNVLVRFWKDGYFEKPRSNDEVKTFLLENRGMTHSNMSVALKSCKFLRRDGKGWIQKMRVSDCAEKNWQGKVDYFKLFQIHQEIAKVSKKLFNDGHYAQAVFEAFKKLNNLVKSKSGLNDDGKSLMLRVFSLSKTILKLNGLNTDSEKDEQEGFMHLFAGAMQGIRNPKGHENLVLKDMTRATEYLVLASLLAKRLDSATK